jgi:hypothetical protein
LGKRGADLAGHRLKALRRDLGRRRALDYRQGMLERVAARCVEAGLRMKNGHMPLMVASEDGRVVRGKIDR